MVIDPIADLLTRIRNAQRVRHMSVRVPRSGLVVRVLEVLKTEGFIEGYQAKEAEGKQKPSYEIWLKYYPNGEPMISSVKRVSKSGRRVYSRCDKLPRLSCGLGISVVSTSEGVMSDREARRRKVGGEVLALVS